MKVQLDREADALYIAFSTDTPHHGVEVPDVEGISLDVDSKGRVIGIEILGASRLLEHGVLAELTLEDLISEQSGTLVLGEASRSTTTSRRVS